MASLTPAEMGVLLSLADGRSQTEIAAERWVSRDTIRSQTKSLYAKLGAANAAQAVAIAYHRRLLIVPGGTP